MSSRHSNRPFIPLALVFLLAAIVVLWLTRWETPWDVTSQSVAPSVIVAPSVNSKTEEAPTPPETTPLPASSSPPPSAGSGRQFDSFRLRPFEVVKETLSHAWTAEDGRSPEAIQNLAHNEVELARLTEENSRIKRRQLVYRKEPAVEQVQRAIATGERVRKLVLPALDGQELEVEITASDLAPSGLKGTFTGQLPGRRQSLVTLAFKEGREAFTVQSPEDGIYLNAQPREPGELMIVTFDLDAYLPLPGGEPIKTQ